MDQYTKHGTESDTVGKKTAPARDKREECINGIEYKGSDYTQADLTAESIASPLGCVCTQRIPESLVLFRLPSRITSYNVCYTKLLRHEV